MRWWTFGFLRHSVSWCESLLRKLLSQLTFSLSSSVPPKCQDNTMFTSSGGRRTVPSRYNLTAGWTPAKLTPIFRIPRRELQSQIITQLCLSLSSNQRTLSPSWNTLFISGLPLQAIREINIKGITHLIPCLYFQFNIQGFWCLLTYKERQRENNKRHHIYLYEIITINNHNVKVHTG
jgi:hypothetical protein